MLNHIGCPAARTNRISRSATSSTSASASSRRHTSHVCTSQPSKSAAAPLSKRQLLGASLALGLTIPTQPGHAAGPQITSKVYMDIGFCPQALRTDRAIGDKSALCPAATPVGRVTFGLYGDAAPTTASNFLRLITDQVYTGTTFHKVVPGKYIRGGKQGSRRYGEVDTAKVAIQENADMVSSSAFATRHERPGTLSWCVTDNDDEPFVRSRPGYENTEFLVTIGASPVFELDGENIAFGQVLEGFDVLSEVAAVPVIKVNETLERYNAVASFLGDERASKARQKWGKPLQAVVITGSGVL